MSKNKLIKYITLLIILAGCATMDDNRSTIDWSATYGTQETGEPATLYGQLPSKYVNEMDPGITHQMAVLLPLSGQNASVGRTIRTSVEMAVLQNAPSSLTVSFYDSNNDLTGTLSKIYASNPEIIIGPVFSSDAQLVRDTKPGDIPVLSFTSDATAIGDGVMTTNFMPTNGIETIVQEMQHDGINRFIIMAPDTESGHLMAGTAKSAADIYNLPLIGIFYYTEKDPDSIKNTGLTASMNNTRRAAHTRARQVLSDILINERITALEKSNLAMQLDKLSKTETIGNIPYDGVLFLGNGDDTKSLASYLRYYDVSADDARFYGTTMWDGSGLASDLTMSGAKFTTMPEMNPEFIKKYSNLAGHTPNRLAAFGYDATNIAIGMIYSDKSTVGYLLDPSGYIGTDGLFRLTPHGASERGLRIMQLDGSGTPREIKSAPTNFLTPLYNLEQRHITPVAAMPLQTPGTDPDDYITLPERLDFKYRSKTIGANITSEPTIQQGQVVEILPEDDSDIVIRASSYEPVRLEPIQRSYIDEYEIIEEE
ncbi:MAG: penicillin-binding protein activator [Alphaproteobacteria bacterium]|nr:penicillin-binding protein activator [Alphaproteobacteria bacterium]